jgi:alanyl-tRNA synthetase
VVKEEEEAFLRTLGKGLRKMEELTEAATAAGDKTIPGKEVFELLDTYGFPVDLTRLIAAENKLIVDESGFEKEMQQQKQRSRAATAVDTEDWVVLQEDGLNEFVGYDSVEIKTRVVKYRKIKAKGKEAYQIVLEATPFYAESGGQVGDTGLLQVGETTVEVFDTKKENDLIIHFTDKIPADLRGEVLAKVDVTKRKATEKNHSATHLLHAALRQVLGTHVVQKGSLVNEEHLRFDFSHFSKVSDVEVEAIESLVNEKIRQNIPVVTKLMKKEEAIAMGAMALFGEKYGDKVRVVMMDPSYSVELCGGTHVQRTGDLGFFKITHETAVAAGVRRIEAVSGKGAEAFVSGQAAQLRAIADVLKNPKDVVRAAENLIAENTELKKKIEALEARQLAVVKDGLLGKVQRIDGVNFIGEVVAVSSADALKKLCFDLKSELTGYLVVLAANIGGKASVAILIDGSVAASRNLDAPSIIKERIAPLIKGGGGGQKTLATAGGQDAGNLPLVIERVKELLG